MKNKLFRFNFLYLILILVFSHAYAKINNNKLIDDLITTKIEAKIAMDKSISIFKVNVVTLNGIVKLSGSVDSEIQARSLVELAQETEGVVDVVADNLVIKDSKRPIIDTLMTAKVKAQLVKNKIITDKNSNTIQIEVKDGVVYLSGNVKNQEVITRVNEFAKLVRGVHSVESRLKIIP